MRPRSIHGSARALAYLLVPVALAGCGDDEPTTPGDDGSTLTVLLTDAPGAVEAVWVQIVEIHLQGGGDGGRVTLLEEPTELIELTDLAGTSRTLIADVEVDPLAYGQLRMVLGDAVLETESGDVYVLGDAEHPDGLPATGELQCPSCQQSGLKVIIPNDEIEIEEGSSALVLDFDVAQSFGHKAGNSGRWVMRPTIMGVLIADENGDGIPDIDQVGAVTGTIALAEGVTVPDCPAGTARDVTDLIPTATAQTLVDGDGAPIVRTGTVDESGAFAMPFLAADDYTLGYQAELEFEAATLAFTAGVVPPEVSVADEAVTGVAYTITAATCEASGG